MSILSNHYPEVLDELNGTACTCPPDGSGPDDFCEACAADYNAYREQQAAAKPFDAELDAVVEILPEGSPVEYRKPFNPPF